MLPLNYTYKQVISDGPQEFVIRVEDNAWIPFDPVNVDYQHYLKWIAEGNTPLPPDTI